MPFSARRTVASAAFAAILASAVPPRSHTPDFDRYTPRHAALSCFAATLLQQTPPRATILFQLPEYESDGGLINHRLRYLLPGRFVRTNLDSGTAPESHPADFIATWSPGHCAGNLERAKR